jgi:alanine dehydrogenase
VLHKTLVLTREDVRRHLTLRDCIDAVADALARHARGDVPADPGVLGTHVPGGGFHVKAATLGGAPAWYAAKVNANFPGNHQHGLPTIQGIIALFEIETGRLLAVLDSIEITTLRTAAASAVAARHLALENASTATICGCGVQGRAHLRALAQVRPLRRVFALDADTGRAQALADIGGELGITVEPNVSLDEALAASDIWVTCTPAHAPIIRAAALRPGVFIAAVGADNPDKQELEPEVLVRSRVVTDLTQQAATIGELHHAIARGVLRESDVYAQLGEIVAGDRPGRTAPDEIFVFDSTGTALQDVAAAAITYKRALEAGSGARVALA